MNHTTAQSFDWRLEWRWLLALSFLLLLPTKNLWNISVLVIAVLGLFNSYADTSHSEVTRVGPTGPLRSCSPHSGCLCCFLCPVLWRLTTARPQLSTRFFFFGLGIMWLLSDPRCRRRLTIAVFVVAAFWTVDALFQALAGFNFFGYALNPRRLQGIFYPRYRLGFASACLAPIWFEGWRLIAARTENRLIIPLALLAALALPAVVLLSGSRSAWLMLGAASSLYSVWLVLLAHRAGRIKITVVVIGLMVGAVVATAVSDEGFRSRFGVSLELFSGDFEHADKATPTACPSGSRPSQCSATTLSQVSDRVDIAMHLSSMPRLTISGCLEKNAAPPIHIINGWRSLARRESWALLGY